MRKEVKETRGRERRRKKNKDGGTKDERIRNEAGGESNGLTRPLPHVGMMASPIRG